jgi:hypothetical protein
VLESELSAVFTDQGPSIAAGILFDPLRAAPDGAAEIHLCSIGFLIGIDGRAVDHSEHCGRRLEGLATKVPAAEKASLIRITSHSRQLSSESGIYDDPQAEGACRRVQIHRSLADRAALSLG